MRLRYILDWMATQPLELMLSSGLLRMIEHVVVDQHRVATRSAGLPWAPYMAYQWMRYESEDPIAALRLAVDRLAAGWRVVGNALDQAENLAWSLKARSK